MASGHLPGKTMLADIDIKALGSSRLRALAEMMGMKMGDTIMKKD